MKIKHILFGILIIFVLLISYYVINRFSTKHLPFYSVNPVKDTTLTIGIIGDSWVTNGKMDSLLIIDLTDNFKGSKKIISSGHPGANTKLIYQHLFEDGKSEYSSRFIIENHPDYCIIIAGLNDAAGQYGARFYAHNVTEIIKTLLHYEIMPVLVELPEFGIIEATNEMRFAMKIRNNLFAIINNAGKVDNINKYREALTKRLESENLIDDILYIDFEDICSNYEESKDLYENPSHLSNAGYKKLCQIIAEELTKYQKVRR